MHRPLWHASTLDVAGWQAPGMSGALWKGAPDAVKRSASYMGAPDAVKRSASCMGAPDAVKRLGNRRARPCRQQQQVAGGSSAGADDALHLHAAATGVCAQVCTQDALNIKASV